MSKVILTRKELYDLVWSESILSLSRRYNYSDAELRKICAKMNIPIPKAGHWQKLKWGKRVIIEQLDDIFTGELNVTLMLRNPDDNAADDTPLGVRQREIEADLRLSLVVPEKLTDPDPLIHLASTSLKNKTHKDYHNGMLSSGHEELKIKVSPEFVGRALCFMDTLIKALRARGHDVYIRNWETCAFVFGEEFVITFKEKTKRVQPKEKWGSSEFQPTGILYFKAKRISYEKIWEDGKVKIENQLSNIIARIEMEGERRRDEMERNRRHWEEIERKKEEQKAVEKVKEKETEEFRDLLREAKLWKQINTLREYIDAIEQRATANGYLSNTLSARLESIRCQANQYDPMEERMKNATSN